MRFWKSFEMDESLYYSCRIGPLVLWLMKSQNELLISEQRLIKDEELGENWEVAVNFLHQCEKPERTNWKRWIIDKDVTSFKFVPVTPNRPVVVRPESPVQIIAGEKTCFYVSIPIFIKLVTGDNKELVEIPILILSNTWFGDPISGELCYAVKSSASTSMERKTAKAYAANCPICISNDSSKQFNFARLSIHTEYLGIFEGENNLWTNQIDVKLEGDEQKSIMDISETAPQIERIKGKLSESREIPSKKFYKKMFSEFSFMKG